MEAKIDFCDVFSNLFFECVSGSHFCCFLEAPNLKNHALASTGARFSQNRRFRKISKKSSISASFSEVKPSKNQETMVLKSVFALSILFYAFFYEFSRFRLDFGRPRELQKLLKIIKNAFGPCSERVWDSGAILGAMLERFWKILNGFREFFGRILMNCSEDFGTQTIIRATKETSIDR